MNAADGAPPAGTFDFRSTQGFARAYLHTYYSGAPQIDEQLLSRFLVREAPRLPRGRFAEIGCGPTIHHVLPIAPFVDEIHLLDYLDENLAEVRRWRDRAAGAHDWRQFTRLALTDAGMTADSEAIDQREQLVRARLHRIAHCNLLRPTPADERQRYDAVGCFYCAEEVGIAHDAWEQVVARVAEHVAPGGTLLMAALAEMHTYHVVDEHGRATYYPCAFVTEASLRDLLPRLGFPAAELRVERHGIADPDVGVTATLMAAARRSG